MAKLMPCPKCGCSIEATSPGRWTCQFCRIMAKTTQKGACRIWNGATRNGLGVARVFLGDAWVVRNVARIVYLMTKGPIPPGHNVKHAPDCRSRLCIEPNHLILDVQPGLGDAQAPE